MEEELYTGHAIMLDLYEGEKSMQSKIGIKQTAKDTKPDQKPDQTNQPLNPNQTMNPLTQQQTCILQESCFDSCDQSFKRTKDIVRCKDACKTRGSSDQSGSGSTGLPGQNGQMLSPKEMCLKLCKLAPNVCKDECKIFDG